MTLQESENYKTMSVIMSDVSSKLIKQLGENLIVFSASPDSIEFKSMGLNILIDIVPNRADGFILKTYHLVPNVQMHGYLKREHVISLDIVATKEKRYILILGGKGITDTFAESYFAVLLNDK